MTATRAFQFCLTYKRTTEFRRLCDILRNHLANLNKCAPPRMTCMSALGCLVADAPTRCPPLPWHGGQ